MISFKITKIKNFINKFLKTETFDNFLLSEAVINSFVNFSITGAINKDFYHADELDDLQNTCIAWRDIKPYAYHIISSNNTPISMKFVLMLSAENAMNVVNAIGIPLTEKDINGLFINIIFKQGTLTLTTGTSLKFFSLDKTLENEWDKFMRKFLLKHEIDFEDL